ncbi:hypothetical protein GWK47_015086 [Chionoecetes opilio]|uniref:Uncharacterized protein n=1 Tax=Chionoecetes opilio TaxID=41210 RepID=A0A8J4Y382_CHIOP|nr:hypothetical protein GWK47_015086 [Chionoecetes opilio]
MVDDFLRLVTGIDSSEGRLHVSQQIHIKEIREWHNSWPSCVSMDSKRKQVCGAKGVIMIYETCRRTQTAQETPTIISNNVASIAEPASVGPLCRPPLSREALVTKAVTGNTTAPRTHNPRLAASTHCMHGAVTAMPPPASTGYCHKDASSGLPRRA